MIEQSPLAHTYACISSNVKLNRCPGGLLNQCVQCIHWTHWFNNPVLLILLHACIYCCSGAMMAPLCLKCWQWLTTFLCVTLIHCRLYNCWLGHITWCLIMCLCSFMWCSSGLPANVANVNLIAGDPIHYTGSVLYRGGAGWCRIFYSNLSTYMLQSSVTMHTGSSQSPCIYVHNRYINMYILWSQVMEVMWVGTSCMFRGVGWNSYTIYDVYQC